MRAGSARRSGLRGLAVAAALLLPAGLASPGCTKPAPAPTTLRVGYSPHDHHAPLYVAAQNPDLFRREGDLWLREITPRREYELVRAGRVLARVAIDESAGGEQLIRRLAEDQFDLAFGGVPAMVYYIDRGSAIRIVAPVMTEGAGLVVRRDLPVSSWREFADLVRAARTPVRIGYKIGRSVQNLIFEEALRAEGIAFSHELGSTGGERLVLLNLQGQKNLIPALEGGLIDGFVANQPLPAKAEYSGAGKLVANLSDLPPAGAWEGNPCCALAAGERYTREHPEAVEAFVTLMLRAGAHIRSHPGEAAADIARWLGLPVPVEAASLPTMHFTTDFDPAWDRGVEFWVRSMFEAAEIDGEVHRAFEAGRLRERVYDRELFDRARRDL